MAIHTTTRATYDNLTVSKVDVTDPIMHMGREVGETKRPGWDVDCTACGENVATLLDTEPDGPAVAAMGHVCATEEDRAMTPRPLTVYTGHLVHRGRELRLVVAAQSKAAAMRALGVSRTEFAGFFHETGNAGDIETATSRPGVVFWQPSPARHRAPLIPWDYDTPATEVD